MATNDFVYRRKFFDLSNNPITNATVGQTIKVRLEFECSNLLPLLANWVDNIRDNYLQGLTYVPASATISNSVNISVPLGLGNEVNAYNNGCDWWCSPAGNPYPSPVGLLQSWQAILLGGFVRVEANYICGSAGTIAQTLSITGPSSAATFNANTLYLDSFNIDWTFDTDSLLIVDASVCIAEGSLVKVVDMKGNLSIIPIEQVHSMQLLVDVNQRPVPLLYNVRFNKPSRKLVKIGRNSLGENRPEKDLYICKGHAMLIRGQEVFPEDLIGLPGVEDLEFHPNFKQIVEKNIFTFVTPRRTFVDVQGLKIGTWAIDSWENGFSNEHRLGSLGWSKQ